MTERTRVALVGDGPAAAAVRAALEEETGGPVAVDPADVVGYDLAVVVALAGDRAFETVHDRRSEPWLAVELGGVGGAGAEAVDAAVSVLCAAGPCYDCLRARVRAARDGDPAPRPAVARADARLAGAHAGRLALAVLAGDAGPGELLELPYAERRLLPVPGCGCDGDRDPGLDRASAAVDVEAAVDRMEGAIDARIGLVTAVGEAASFPAPYYLATLADTAAFAEVTAGPQAAGVAAEWHPAFAKAVGEALERYAAGVYRTPADVEAPAASLANAVGVDRFVRPEEGVEAFDPAAHLRWVVGEDLLTGEPVHLPAEFVHFPPREERFAPAITTGLGLGSSGAAALVSGLSEVLERDATMLAWYSTFEPLALEVDEPSFAVLERRARAEDLEVTPLLVTQDVDIPVVVVAVHRDDDWPRFAVGSGAALDPADAATGALEEALQNWMELRGMGPEGVAEESTAIGRYADFPPAARSLVDVEGSVPAASVGPDELPSGADVLPALLERVEAAGLEAFAARLTTRDVEGLGFEAVRVLVPSAQPLFIGERFFGERARTVPRALGFRPRLDRPPHPYP